MRANASSERLEALVQGLTDQIASLTSTLTSPTPPTTPTPSSDVLLTMMTTLTQMFREERRETREMVLDILQGRATRVTGQTETESIENAQPTSYNADETPLPPEIEAVLEREKRETDQEELLQASLRERAVLQQRAAMVEEEMSRLLSLGDSSPGLSEEPLSPSWDESTPR